MWIGENECGRSAGDHERRYPMASLCQLHWKEPDVLLVVEKVHGKGFPRGFSLIWRGLRLLAGRGWVVRKGSIELLRGGRLGKNHSRAASCNDEAIVNRPFHLNTFDACGRRHGSPITESKTWAFSNNLTVIAFSSPTRHVLGYPCLATREVTPWTFKRI